METRYFHKVTYCPLYDEHVSYDETCYACDYNQYYDGILETVDCSYEENENG